MRIAELFRITRIAKGIKQFRLAELVGISVSAFARFEGGKLALSNETLLRITPYLDINPEYVLGASKYPFKNEQNGLIKYFVDKNNFWGDLILATIKSSSNYLEIYSLTPHLSILERIRHLNVADQPTYALLIRDGFSNLFVIRCKSHRDFMIWDNTHITRDAYFMKMMGMQGWCDKICMTKDLYEKIVKWDDLCAADFEDLMEESKKDSNFNTYKIVCNDMESYLINNIRKRKIRLDIANKSIGLMDDIDKNNIDPDEVRELVRRHYDL